MKRATVLIVDDRPENLDALEVTLEPLGVTVLRADSGAAALRVLLEREVAVIVLDVRMPGMDGFETASLIKQRPRTRHVPIIFLTAMAGDRDEAVAGYETGAVDFMEKPFEPVVLRSKVETFAELHLRRLEVAQQAELLREAEAREAAYELERSQRRYYDLADAMPAIVFAVDTYGAVTYVNEQWRAFSGGVRVTEDTRDRDAGPWSIVHPSDRAGARRSWDTALEQPGSLPGGTLEMELRLRRHDGVHRWHLVRCVPMRSPDGAIEGWVGTATDVDTARRNETAQRLLAEAGAVVAASAQWRDAVGTIAELVVPELADWCSVDVIDAHGELRRVAFRCDGDLSSQDVERLGTVLAPEHPGSPAARLVDGSEPALQRVVLGPDCTELRGAVDEQICALAVPLVARGTRLGSLSVAMGHGTRTLGDIESRCVRELASRIASAIDTTRLFRDAERRAQAAEVLDAIADGVALIDDAGVVRLWNPAAAEITGVTSEAAIGEKIVDVLPGWSDLATRVPVAAEGVERTLATTVPLDLGDRDLWLSVSAVGFARGVAFAFRDLSAERAVERMKTDFVATVSHELRTPLASIYGAAVTMQRDDIQLDDAMRQEMVDVIGSQSQRLADIVEDVLTTSSIDAGSLLDSPQRVDGAKVVQEVMDAARLRTNGSHVLQIDVPDDLPALNVDPGHLRQVLGNLVDNAIKYSPDGGDVVVRGRADDGMVVLEVIDEGVGVAPSEQRRIFDKFYRTDANMIRGIGGTGLGLFIVRELVRRMGGRIDVESRDEAGSTFTVQLPMAKGA